MDIWEVDANFLKLCVKLFECTVEFIIPSNGDKLKNGEVNKPSSGATTGLWVCLLIPSECPAVT